MNTRHIFYPFIIAALTSIGGIAMAQETDELDLTMDLLEEGETPEDIVEPIALPEDASPQGVESSADGLATANEARERGREFGQDTAAEARQRGEDARDDASDNAEEALSRARQNVKDNIPAGTFDNIPEHVRDNVPEHVRDRIPSGSDDIADIIGGGNAATDNTP